MRESIPAANLTPNYVPETPTTSVVEDQYRAMVEVHYH